MSNLTSNMSPEDKNAIDEIEEQLRKMKISLSGNEEVSKDAEVSKDNLKSTEVKEFEKEIKEDEFNISKIKDEPSGYDQGALEKLEKEIAKGKSLGLDVSALVLRLEKMIAEMEREKSLNEDQNDENKQDSFNKVILSNMSDSDDDELSELRKEAFELFQSLLSRGIIAISEMAAEFINSDDGDEVEVNRDNVYIANAKNPEELAELNKFIEINQKIFGGLQQDDLMENFSQKTNEDGKVAQAYSCLGLKNYDGETDFRKLSLEEQNEMRKLFEENPDNFKIYTHAVGDEKMLPDLIKENEAVLSNKLFEFKSFKRDQQMAEILGIPVATPFTSDGKDVPPQAIAHAVAIPLVEIIAMQRNEENTNFHNQSFVEKISAKYHGSQNENEGR